MTQVLLLFPFHRRELRYRGLLCPTGRMVIILKLFQLLGAEMQLIALRIKEKVFFRIYKVQDDLTQEPKSQFQEFSFLLLTSA